MFSLNKINTLLYTLIIGSVLFASYISAVLGVKDYESLFIYIITLFVLVGIFVNYKDINKKLIILIILNLFSIIIHYQLSFSVSAANAAIKIYLFSLLVILYSYSLRNNFVYFSKIIIFYSIFLSLFQIYITSMYYLFGYSVYELVMYKQFDIIRSASIFGTGGVDIFSTYSLVAFILNEINNFKYKKIFRYIFLISLISGFTFKSLLFVIPIILLVSNFRGKLVNLFIIVLSLFLFYDVIITVFDSKFNSYVDEAESARNESYRIMFDVIKENNLFGKGIASFGNSISVRYNSPIYNDYNFNWYDLDDKLSTTDTGWPGVFVNFGLYFGLLYSILFIFPVFYIKKYNLTKKQKYIALLFIFYLLWDAVSADSISSYNYQIILLPFYFSIMQYFQEQNLKKINQ